LSLLARGEEREGLHIWRAEASACGGDLVAEEGEHCGVVREIVWEFDGCGVTGEETAVTASFIAT
jgi:hypothetical protein